MARHHAQETIGEIGRNHSQFVGFSYVYAVHAPLVKRWKFGITNTDPLSRLRNLDVQSCVELELYGAVSIPGNRQIEKAIHTVLKPWHARGEWFEESDAVLAIASRIRKQDVPGLKFLLLQLAQKQLPAEAR